MDKTRIRSGTNNGIIWKGLTFSTFLANSDESNHRKQCLQFSDCRVWCCRVYRGCNGGFFVFSSVVIRLERTNVRSAFFVGFKVETLPLWYSCSGLYTY